MTIVCTLLTLYVLVILVRIVMSWFPIDPDGLAATIHGFFHLLTEPVLGPLRRALPPVRLGGVALDLSPIIVLVGIQILRNFIC